jgi:hypothetical protein
MITAIDKWRPRLHTESIRQFAVGALLACLTFYLIGCGGQQPATSPASSKPAITSISPSGILAGSGSFSLTVIGSNFNSSSMVQWNGSPRTTEYVNSTQLNAVITALDVSTAGTWAISVRNTAPSILTSNLFNFRVTNPQPIITSIYPSSVTAGSGDFALIIYGRNFISDGKVKWGDKSYDYGNVWGDPTRLLIYLYAVNEVGNRSLSITNPAPGGEKSNSVSLNIIPSDLTVLTKILPDASSSKPYSYALKVIGGRRPYKWFMQLGSLPANLTLSEEGVISGTPPAVAMDTINPFTVFVSSMWDFTSEEHSAVHITQDLSIRVRNGSLPRNDTCGPDSTAISNGIIRASLSPYGDRDVYSFQGTAGNPVTIEIFAERIPLYGNPLDQDIYMDSFLEILNNSCSMIQYNDDIDPGVLHDSKISDYALPYTGTYYIRVSDLRGDGRPDFQYELQLSGAD